MTWVLKEDRAIASQGAAHEAGGVGAAAVDTRSWGLLRLKEPWVGPSLQK